MKLLKIYEEINNKILLNELFDMAPYPYRIDGNLSSGLVRIRFKAKTTNPNVPNPIDINYVVSISYDYSSSPVQYEGEHYKLGYKSIDITFTTDATSGFSALTNQGDKRVFATIGQAVKKLILDNDIQLINFTGASKPGNRDGGKSRTNIYNGIALALKPPYYEIKKEGTHITIYQKEDYYDRKRNIGRYANTTNTTSTPTDNVANIVPKQRRTRTSRETEAGRTVAPRYDSAGNVVSDVTVVSPTAPPEARRTRRSSTTDSQEIYSQRRLRFTYEIYRTKKQIAKTNDKMAVKYTIKDETGFNNIIEIISKKAETNDLNTLSNFGVNTNTINSDARIAKVTMTTRNTQDQTFIYRFLRTFITQIGIYVRTINKEDKAIIIELPTTGGYVATLFKQREFIKLKEWYISKRKYTEFVRGNTFILYKK